jgi:hypothetical protein
MHRERVDDRSFIERFQSRSRVRWLVDTYSSLTQADSPTEIYPNQNYDDWLAQKEAVLEEALKVATEDEINLEAYSNKRINTPSWTTVEIGPGGSPMGLNRSFAGKSRYIGLENNSYREHFAEHAIPNFQKMAAERPDENIELMMQDFGKQIDGQETNYRYDLPDAIADEMFLRLVYDKPAAWTSCEHNNDEQAMTYEIARLLKPEGLVTILDFNRNTEKIHNCLINAGLRIRFISRKTHSLGHFNEDEVLECVIEDQQKSIAKTLGARKGQSDLVIIASK